MPYCQIMKIEEEIKQSKFRNAHQKAIINLIYTTNWLFTKQQELLKPYHITSQQFNILRILRGQHPKSISGTEIKSRMLDKNSDVSRLLDRLAAKDLITKNICPQDKRAVDVAITEEGMKLLQTIDKRAEEMDSLLDLTEEEATIFSNLLDKARS
jgi:DNA-binding MarR family transcriptional regulator